MGGFFSSEKHRGFFSKKMNEPAAEYKFPDHLEGFGYHFDRDGVLRQLDTNEKFVYEVKKGDYSYNQQRYNALGELITEYLYKMMQHKFELKKEYLPVGTTEESDNVKSFIFMSEDALTNQDKLLILVHGSGAVRAGQWARRLIMNDNLDKGSQFPFIKWGLDNGYGVIVANPNLNLDKHVEEEPEPKTQQEVLMRFMTFSQGNANPEEHMKLLWTELVQKSKAKNIAFVAHSFGGIAFLEMTKDFLEEVKERVFAVALTDSVHCNAISSATPEIIEFYKQRVINWASAFDPLDAPLESGKDPCPTKSAGTDRHEYTSYSSMESIFKWFPERYEWFTKGRQSIPDSKTVNSDKVPAISALPTPAGEDNSKASGDAGDNDLKSSEVVKPNDIVLTDSDKKPEAAKNVKEPTPDYSDDEEKQINDDKKDSEIAKNIENGAVDETEKKDEL